MDNELWSDCWERRRGLVLRGRDRETEDIPWRHQNSPQPSHFFWFSVMSEMSLCWNLWHDKQINLEGTRESLADGWVKGVDISEGEAELIPGDWTDGFVLAVYMIGRFVVALGTFKPFEAARCLNSDLGRERREQVSKRKNYKIYQRDQRINAILEILDSS